MRRAGFTYRTDYHRFLEVQEEPCASDVSPRVDGRQPRSERRPRDRQKRPELGGVLSSLADA